MKYGVHASDVGFRNGQIGYYTPSNGGVYGGYTIDNEGVRNFNNAVEVGFTFVPLTQQGSGDGDYPWYHFFADGNPGGDFLYEVNKFNPLAVAVNSINAYFTGKDFERGNPMSEADATLNLASIIPIGKVLTVGKLVVQSNAITHIFRNAIGHVNPGSATSQLRYLNLFSRVASNPNNLVPTTHLAARQAGVQTYMQTFNNGQVWVQVRNGAIFDAGVNKIPR